MDDGEQPVDDEALRDALRRRGRGIALKTVVTGLALTAAVYFL
jgi:hypothetical protein